MILFPIKISSLIKDFSVMINLYKKFKETEVSLLNEKSIEYNFDSCYIYLNSYLNPLSVSWLWAKLIFAKILLFFSNCSSCVTLSSFIFMLLRLISLAWYYIQLYITFCRLFFSLLKLLTLLLVELVWKKVFGEISFFIKKEPLVLASLYHG